MSRFLIGLLLGLLAGIAGASAFLIVYGGGDYLVSTSPRVRELEASLRHVDEDRDWLKTRLRESTEATQRLESRFEALAARFERISGDALAPAAAPDAADADRGTSVDLPAATSAPEPTATDPHPGGADAALDGDALPSPSPTP